MPGHRPRTPRLNLDEAHPLRPAQRRVPRRPLETALLVGLLALAAAFRSYDLGARALWVDEANGVLMARQGVAELVARLKLDSNPPLYYLLLSGWMSIFGDSEAALRSLSVVCGVALVGLVFLCGRRMFSVETGMLAAVLLTFSPIQIFYSQQARMYVLLALLALLSASWLWRGIATGRRRFVGACGGATLAALYVHNCALYLLPAHAVVLLWSGALRRKPWSWLTCAACIGAGYAPWVPVLRAQLANPTQYGWFVPVWRELGPFGVLWKTLHSFVPGGTLPAYMHLSGPRPIAWLPPVLFAVVAGLSLVWLCRGRGGAASQRAHVGWLLTFVGVPLIGAIVTSAWWSPNYVPARTDQLVFPAFVLLLAVGFTVLRPLALRYVGLAAWIGFAMIPLKQYYTRQLPNSDRELAQAVSARAQGGDAVLTTSLTRASLEYYLGRSGAPVTLFSFPRDTALHLGNQDDTGLLAHPERLKQEAAQVRQQLEAHAGPHGRVFLILVPAPVNQPLYDELLAPGRASLLFEVGEFRQALMEAPVRVVLLQL